MVKHRRVLIMAALALWTLMFAGIVATVFRPEVEDGLEKRVLRVFRYDPELQGVEVVFHGANGRLEGTVAEAKVIAKAQRVATRLLPLGEISENKLTVAPKSPSLRATLEGDVVVLDGEISDQLVRSSVLDTLRKLPGVEGVRDKLRITPEVHRSDWMTPFLHFLPGFFDACPDGAAEATDQRWSLSGQLKGELERDVLAESWKRLVPEGGEPNLSQLVFATPAAKPAAPAVEVAAVKTPDPTPEPVAIRAVPIQTMPETEPEPATAPPTPAPDPALAAAEAKRRRTMEAYLETCTVNFAPSATRLTSAEIRKLRLAAESLRTYNRPYKLEILAWVDSSDREHHSQWLSDQRTMYVLRLLEEYRVTVEKRTFRSGRPEDGRNQVQMRLMPTPTAPAEG